MKLLVLTTAVLAATPVFASKELATKNACLACHATDKKLVGPTYILLLPNVQIKGRHEHWPAAKSA
jgi:cytochrome c551/c552